MKGRAWIAPVVLVAIAALVRWVPGGTLSLGVDEGSSLLTALPPLAEIMPSIIAAHEVHPPLYYFYLHPWIALLEPGAFERGGLEAWFRFSGLPWALLTVVLTWRLGVLLGGPRTGVVAGLLIAVSNYTAYYALEVRMYPMLTVFVLAAAWAVLAQARLNAVVFCLLAFLTHYIALFFIAALGLFCALDTQAKRWIVPGLLIAVLLAAWSPLLQQQAGAQEFTMRGSPSWPQAIDLFFQMGYGVTWPVPLPGWRADVSLPSVRYLGLVIVALIVGGLVRAEPRARRLLTCLLAVPLAAVFAVSLLTSFSVFEYKYFQPLAPFVCVAIALWVRPREDRDRVGFLVVGLLLAVNLCAWVGFSRRADWYGPQNWRDVTRTARTTFGTGDVVLVHPSMMAGPVLIYGALQEAGLLRTVFVDEHGPVSRVVPVDSAFDPPLLRALSIAPRAWLWTTLAHPYVAQQRLIERLPSPWKATLVGESESYWPANRIQIFMLQR